MLTRVHIIDWIWYKNLGTEIYSARYLIAHLVFHSSQQIILRRHWNIKAWTLFFGFVNHQESRFCVIPLVGLIPLGPPYNCQVFISPSLSEKICSMASTLGEDQQKHLEGPIKPNLVEMSSVGSLYLNILII